MKSEYVPLLVVVLIVWVIIIPFISFIFGRHLGRNCSCCGYAKICYPCDRYCKPGTQGHIGK